MSTRSEEPEKTRILNSHIDQEGYDKAVADFLKHNPHLKNQIADTRRMDWIFHLPSSSSHRHSCLEIGSYMGNVSEKLSLIYDQVYSLDRSNQNLAFQKRRFLNSRRLNIALVRCTNWTRLPFKDGSFDLVVCNNILPFDTPEDLMHFLSEIRRILSKDGCFVVGIKNKYGIDRLFRNAALSRIRDDKLSSSNLFRKKIRQHSLALSFWRTSSLLRESNFVFKAYWTFPMHDLPYFVGLINDGTGIQGFVSHLINLIKGRIMPGGLASRIALSIFRRMDTRILVLSTKLTSPGFLFYCSLEKIEDSIDELVIHKSGLHSFIRVGGAEKILYFLYDSHRKPVKVASLKRNIMNKAFKKAETAVRPLQESIELEDWIHGRMIDPLNLSDIRKALDWLAGFQTTNQKEILTTEDILRETSTLQKSLMLLPHLNTNTYHEWLLNYESYARRVTIRSTSEHGDFHHGNILVDSEGKLHVIDWGHNTAKGNPLYDAMFLILDIMRLTKSSLGLLQNNFGSGRYDFIGIEIKRILDNHFNVDLNIDILIRYAILRFVIRKELQRGIYDKDFIIQYDLLDLLTSAYRK